MGFRRSEYRRQFKEPSWDAHQEQYRQLVSYRTYRRARENHHDFVEWDWDTESDEHLPGGGAHGTPRASQARQHPTGGRRGGSSAREPRVHRDAGEEGRDIARRGLAEREVQTPDWDAERPGGRTPRDGRGKKRGRPEQDVSEISPRPKTTPGRGSYGAGEDRVRPPLLAYGWADGKRDVGCKKTFNVRASVHGDNSQVFPAALRAMRRNEYAIKYREEQRRHETLRKRRLRAAFNVPPPDDDDGGMWTTEYRRNYSGKPTTSR